MSSFSGDFKISHDLGINEAINNIDDDSNYNYSNQKQKNYVSMESFGVLKERMENLTQDGGVKKEILKKGIGEECIEENDIITFHYTGYLEASDVPFDSTYLRNKPQRSILREKRLIIGFQVGIATMKLKEVSRFIFEPNYAFFDDKHGLRIPKNSTVMFEIEIIDIQKFSSNESYFDIPEHERMMKPLSEIFEIINIEKNKAACYFKSNKYKIAINIYKSCLEILFEHSMQIIDENATKYNNTHISILNNIALCYFNIKNFRNSEKYSKKVLKIDNCNTKATYRLALSYIKLSKFDKANSIICEKLENIENVINDEDFEELKKYSELMRLETKLEEVEFAKKMFGDEITISRQINVDNNFKEIIEKYLINFRENELSEKQSIPLRGISENEKSFIKLRSKEVGLSCSIFDEPNNCALILYK